MGRLRQILKNNLLTVTTTEPQLLRAKNLPVSITIDLDEDPNIIGPPVEGYHPEWSVKKDNHFGNKYSDGICNWFSVAIEKEVVAIRAPSMLRMKNDGGCTVYTKRDDLRKGYQKGAAFHIINKTSVNELRQRIIDRHPKGIDNLYVTTEQFRANMVIEWPESFAEDRFFEFRLG